MSTYITASRAKYEVNDSKLERAEEWLRSRGYDNVSSASYRENTSILYANCDDDFFGGSTAWGWDEEVTEFMREFCLPTSYATFRIDEEYEWTMAQVDECGNVKWHNVEWVNPFEEECDRLEQV